MIDDMQVYIANLGKYNEGELVGDWFSFPLDEEVIAERIGLNAEYEEYAIHDTDNFPMEISEYTSIEELNRIYEQLEELPDYLLDDLDSFVSYYGSLEELVEHKDDIILYSGCETMTDLAYYLIDEERSDENSSNSLRQPLPIFPLALWTHYSAGTFRRKMSCRQHCRLKRVVG